MLVSHFQIGSVPELHQLNPANCAPDPPSPQFLGSHRCCSPILTYNAIALQIAIPPSQMFHLAFAASINLCITRENFEDHIIKFGRLEFVERKCQPLNINVNR